MTEPIHDALRRLRDNAAGQKAPDTIEIKLAAAFRERHASRKRRLVWTSVAIAASVLVLLALANTLRLRQPQIAAPVAGVEVAGVEVAGVKDTISVPVARAQDAPRAPIESSPGQSASKPKYRQKRAPIPQPSAKALPAAQEFIEIPYAPPLTAYDGGRVVRVNMPGASVRSLGLPVMSDRVQADVFLGDDGVARAIRLVSNSGLN